MVDIVFNRREWIDRRNVERREDDVGFDSEQRSGGNRRVGNERRTHIHSFIKNNCDQYAESLKWEFSLLSDTIRNTQRKKLMIIGSSMALLSVILTLLLSFYSLRYSDVTANELSEDLFVIGLLTILMGVGLINFGAIKYVAALKSAEIIYKRQLTCLRQALDAVRFYLIEGVFPRNRVKTKMDKPADKMDDFDNEKSNYWMIFGNHRKLPIDNFGVRRHMESMFESSDKLVIMIQFIIAELSVLLPVGYYIISLHNIQGMWVLAVFSMLCATFGGYVVFDSFKRIGKAVARCTNEAEKDIDQVDPGIY